MKIRRILVCMKAVQITALFGGGEEGAAARDMADLQWNVADESALEAALRLAGGEGEVAVLTMGPFKLESLLKELAARGAGETALITDSVMAGADTHATAMALKAAAERLGPFDLILCGRRTIDGETGQVPGELAAALGLPCVSEVERIDERDGRLTLFRRVEGGVQELQARWPLVISLCEYAYPLRLANIMGIRRARMAPVKIFHAADLNLEPWDCGQAGSLTEVVSAERKLPGLRCGEKETDLKRGTARLFEMIEEVRGWL